MNDLDTKALDEALRERAEALPGVGLTPDRLMRTARSQRRRDRAYGALGGVAAVALVVSLAVQSGQVTSAPTAPAAPSNPVETAPTIDQAARANRSHAWALSLPAGSPQHRWVGYDVERRRDRVAVILPQGDVVLPEGVRAVSSPTKVADGWLFIGHGTDRTGEEGIDELGSTVLHVRTDLSVGTVLEAEVVASLFPSPDGRRAAVVTARATTDQVVSDTATIVTLDSLETVQVPLPSDGMGAVATWDGDRVALMGNSRGWGSTFHVYDLAERRWSLERASSVGRANSTVRLVATAAAMGGSTRRSLVAMDRAGTTCIHLMTGPTIDVDELACSPDHHELLGRVSPGGRYAVVGQGWNGRVNTGTAARVIDLTTGRDVAGIPQEMLDVGAFHLIWEDDHTLIGQATRATPVHDGATQFRWDLVTGSGESLGFDPAQGPLPTWGPEPPVLL